MVIKKMSTPFFGANRKKKSLCSSQRNPLSNLLLRERIFDIPLFPQIPPQWEAGTGSGKRT